MEKYIKDNKVAVVIAPSFGAGWSSWNYEIKETLVFHPAIYIFVGHREWHWSQKVIGMIVATIGYSLILPLMCGIYLGVKYAEESKDGK